jgi:Fe-S-cluster containining protein
LTYDCQRCGACCCNPSENEAEGYRDYIAIEPNNSLLKKPHLVRRFTILNNAGEPHMKLADDGRCSALTGTLGERVSCVIYANRPSACRRVQAGSAACDRYRRDKGIT